jgi:UDP-N-acetylmuramoyl-L-alanyl-D-glutamate--2,6-diaminopimelate ligase
VIRVPLSLVAAAVPGARLSGRPDVLVRGLSADSKQVQAGDCFACLRGLHADGHTFAAQAVRRGAVAILADRPVSELENLPVGVVTVPDVAQALLNLAPKFYGQPTQRLRLIGVTGTNGKTTITHLLRSVLGGWPGPAQARRIGVIGTISHTFAGRVIPAHNTTPPAWDLQRLFHDMVAAGCDTAVMEVSSHALAQGRVEACEFDVAVFTNLSPEHLDFHKTLAEYAAAKQKLFAQLVRPGVKPGPKTAVVNADDPNGALMAQAAAGARILTFGLKVKADFSAVEVQVTPRGSRFRLVTPQGAVAIKLSLLGEYNIANALAAAATGAALGVPLAAVKRGLERVAVVPGRMDRLPGPQPFTVLVDFAHTPDALEQALRNVRLFTRGRVIVVFGCGGDRDTSKRAPMGQLAARLADEVIVTSDNPRSEDPARIIAEVLAGCRSAQRECRTEADRLRAIRLALSLAQPGDTVLLAGKGHEGYQILKDRTVPFDDKKIAARELTKLGYGKNNRRRKQS